MPGREHHYQVDVEWTGNLGAGTANYRAYSRNHEIGGPGKAARIPGSSDPAFRGDASRYNPEDLLVSALSACHMLWVLHLCADARIVVTAYTDSPVGTMIEHEDGSGEFTSVVLRPCLTIADAARAPELDAIHHRAHAVCALARSVRCDVRVEGRLKPNAT